MPTAVQPLINTIHKGADALVSDPAVSGTAAAPATVSDGQARRAAPTRQESVDLMVAGGTWTDGDRPFLMGLDDGKFAKVSAKVLEGANQTIIPYTYDGIKDRSNVHNTQTQGQPVQPVTVEQYIQNAPPVYRDILQDMANTHAEEKKRCIAAITANASNRFAPAWLDTQPLQVLRGMAMLAKQPAPQVQNQGYGPYSGQGDAPAIFSGGGAIVGNADGSPAVLPMPNWDEAASA